MRSRLLDLATRPAIVAAIAVLFLRGSTLVSRLLLSLLLARMLSPDEMGGYGLITAVLAFALLGLGLEFYSYTYREMVPAPPEQRVRIIADEAALGGVTFLAVVILSILAVIAGLFPARLAPWFLLILLTEHISLEATRFLIIMSRSIRAYMVVFLRGAIWVYAIAVLMIAVPSSRSLETVLVFWALGGAASILFTAVSLRDLPWGQVRNRRPDWIWIANGLRTARPFMLTAGGALVIAYVDRFVIDVFVGREPLGIYTFYSTIQIGLLSLGASISHQFLPKVIAGYAAGPAAYRGALSSHFWSMLALACVTIAISAVSMAPLLSLLGLSTYLASIGVFYAMLPGIFFRMLADVPSYGLYAARSDNYLLLCNVASAAVSTLLNLLLVPIYGIYGAALTSGVASAVMFLSQAGLNIHIMRETSKRPAEPKTAGLPTDPDILYP